MKSSEQIAMLPPRASGRSMHRPGVIHERLVGLFLLGVVLFTPPFIGIFNSGVLILGVPKLYLYLFAAWALLIALVALVVETQADDDTAGHAMLTVPDPGPSEPDEPPRGP